MIEALWPWRVFWIQTLYHWAPCWFVWPAVELSCCVSPLYSSCATNKASRSHRGDSALFDLETSCSSLPLVQEPVEGAANPSTCIFRSSAKTQSQFSVFSPGLLGGNWYSFFLCRRVAFCQGDFSRADVSSQLLESFCMRSQLLLAVSLLIFGWDFKIYKLKWLLKGYNHWYSCGRESSINYYQYIWVSASW